MSNLQKNVAGQNMTYALINASSGAALTGATVTAYVAKDGGSQATTAGTNSELGHGQYNYAPTQAETNANDVGFLFTAASAIPVNYDFHTDVVDTNGDPIVAPNWASVQNPTASVNLASTTISTGQTIASATSVTGSVGSVTGSVGGSVAGSVGSVIGNIGGSLAGSVGNVLAIGGSTTAATQIGLSGQKIGNGTVGTGSTTTSIVTSALNPSNTAAGQFQGRIVIFDIGTTTTNLRGQATAISTDSGSGTLTVAALTTAPVSGDTFTVT